MAPPSDNEKDAPVAWRDGVQIIGTVVWCDARRARDLCFLSHAARSTRRAAGPAHGKVLTTARTLALLSARRAAPHGEALVTPLRRPFSLGAARLELFPSGHLPGAASLLVEANGRRVVYAGEIDPRAGSDGGLAEAMEVRGAETAVIEAPLASLPGSLPPPSESRAALVAAVRRACDERWIPVVLAPPLGGAEEVIAALAAVAEEGIALYAHPMIIACAAAYRTLGIDLPSLKRFRAALARDRATSPRCALIWPLELRHAAQLSSLPRIRRIAATGLALDPAAARKLGVDEAIPLADQTDLDGLCSYVAHTGARTVYLTAGYHERVARALISRGRAKRVEPLGPPSQMDLFR